MCLLEEALLKTQEGLLKLFMTELTLKEKPRGGKSFGINSLRSVLKYDKENERKSCQAKRGGNSFGINSPLMTTLVMSYLARSKRKKKLPNKRGKRINSWGELCKA